MASKVTGFTMRMLIPAAILAVLALVSPATPDDPKAIDLENALFPLCNLNAIGVSP
jgi:hypothetical protein